MKKPCTTLLLLFLGSLAFSESCSTVPLTGRKQFTAIPSSQMLALSEDSYATVLEGSNFPPMSYYVNTVKQLEKS